MDKLNSKQNKTTFNWPIVGHKNVIQFLEKSIINNKLAHAYLFIGPPHVGKRTLAENFIANILCQGRIKPCGECLHCRQLKTGFHPDIFRIKREIDKSGKNKKNISIEQIRLLKKNLSNTAFAKSYKFAVILEAEYLGEGASNALLKTLEEPTAKTILILISSQAEKILPTIKSRCQLINFLPVNNQEISDYLKNLSIKKSVAQTFISLSQGRPGIVIKFLNDQNSFSQYNKQTELILELFNKKNLTEKFKILETIINFKNSHIVLEELENLFDNWILIARDIILVKNFSTQFVANQNLIEKIEKIQTIPNQTLLSLISNLQQAKNYLRQNINPKLISESLMLNF